MSARRATSSWPTTPEGSRYAPLAETLRRMEEALIVVLKEAPATGERAAAGQRVLARPALRNWSVAADPAAQDAPTPTPESPRCPKPWARSALRLRPRTS